MKILDRYIIKRYFGKLVWSIILATVVFIVVDLVQMLDKFIDNGVPVNTVVHFYQLYIPYIIYLILPVATLLATLFTIGGFTITNELSAMMVSGVSFYRPLGLLLVAAVFIACGGFMLSETIVPEANRQRMDIYRYDVKKLPRETRSKFGQLYLQVGRNQQLSIDRYNPDTREAYGIHLVSTENGRLKMQADAEKMIWRDDTWHFQGAVRRTFDKQGNVHWERNPEISVSGKGLKPDALEKVQTSPEEMNWVDLREFIDKMDAAGGNTTRWQVDLLFKVSLPAAAVIIVLFGAPIASIRRRGGTALGFGLALFICFIYFGFIQVGKVLGYNGSITPLVSAWIGNVFFGFLGLIILFKWAR